MTMTWWWAGLAAVAMGGLTGAQGVTAGQSQTFVVSCPGGTSQGCTTYSVEKGLLICYCGTERVVLKAQPDRSLTQLRAGVAPQQITLRGGAGTRTLYVFSTDAKVRSALAGGFQAEWVQGAAGPALNISFQRR
ncbi:hypothetical protein [Deinococcus sedimenti]|uniref:Uncharacterized protein n=1 Tax=Deinococcus sedimenti TaxID=1867090 RepID=A0ABQ2S722_9DEIO|nr:hypothetical protein [Deinococcus sedimenti]GGR95658.1 hypothetical protein GCM10008960_23200 [Deinococcus sedimenti]